jgi:hypothetical protein
MRAFLCRASLIVAFVWALAVNASVTGAQSVAPQPAVSASPASPLPATPAAGPASEPPLVPSNGEPEILPNPEPSVERPGGPGAAPIPVPATAPAASPGAPPSSAPAANPNPAGRFHLHRPGTDVDGDLLTGSLASELYVLKGNVTLHSDPTIDREVADASESTQPLTVTADEIDVDRSALTYVGKGHVRFTQGTRSGSADVAMLDEQKHTLDLIGNADVRDGDHRTAAEKLHYNTVDKVFLGAGDVRIYNPLPTPNPNASGTPPPKHKRRLPL